MTVIEKRIPITRVSLAIQVAGALEQGDVTPDAFMRALGLPPWHLCDPHGFMPIGHVNRLMERGARSTGMETFGVRVLESTPFTAPGTIGERAAGARSVQQALRTIVRSFPAFGTTLDWWLEEKADEIWLCCDGPRPFDFGNREMTHYCLALMVRAVQMGAGPNWRPAKICIPLNHAMGLETEEMFADTQQLATRGLTAIAIPRSVLSLPIRCRRGSSAPSGMQEPADDFAGSLRQVMTTLLGASTPQIDTAAEISGTTVRSLQRRLAGAGITYKRLLEEARYDAARKLFADPRNKIIDVAYHVGYSDPAHFTRAFRRFAGVTPREYRARHLPH